MVQRPRKLQDNLLAFSAYLVEETGMLIAVSEPKLSEEICAETMTEEDARGQANIERDRPALDDIMLFRVRKKCDVQPACLYVEAANRSAAEFRAGKPYRESVSYELCYGERRVVVNVLNPPGEPMTDAVRDLANEIVRPYKEP